MLVEEYIESLKSSEDKGNVRHIKKEYNKVLDHLISETTITGKLTCYPFILLGLFCGIIPFILKGNLSIIIRLIYSLPTIIVSIITFVLYRKLVKNNFKDKKVFQQYLIGFFLIYVVSKKLQLKI